MIIGTGFEDTKENCDAFLVRGHIVLLSVGDSISYSKENKDLGVTRKHHTEDRYFCLLNKESFPKWEAILNALMSPEQLSSYGDVDVGEQPET